MSVKQRRPKHYRSATLDAVPPANEISLGEIAVNYNADSIGLFIKDSNGAVRKFYSLDAGIAPIDCDFRNDGSWS